jgi:long-chain acyl-CoA synthetase
MQQTQDRISIVEAYAGKHVLLTGGSGFVGKVWLAMALMRLPDIGRVYFLLRGKGRDVKQRFNKIVNETMAFRTLHERHGPHLSEFMSSRVEVIEGDVSSENLGIDPEVAKRLHEQVDLVINCAGLVDFNPDVRDALGSNVDGALNVADFVEACDHAALLHVSTCYVAGQREGRVPETIWRDKSPNGTELDANDEYNHLEKLIADAYAENDAEETVQKLREDVLERLHKRGYEPSEKRVSDMVGRLKRKWLRERMAQVGTDRARELGWPNTYTYTKALAELMLCERPNLPFSVLRPAIVESAVTFPFAGWNEGFNTSGPLVYLAGTWFRHVPARAGNPLDVIPVDLICNALFIVGAALMDGKAHQVYQCGSSDRNFLPVDRLTELSALGHRRHLRDKGIDRVEKLVLSRWDARASDPEHVLKVGNVRRAVSQVTRYLRHGLPSKVPSEVREWADDLAGSGENQQRKLRQIEEVLDLFMPFTYDHYVVFECRSIDSHPVLEPEFRFEPESIDWRPYWLEIHMPGLRKWCFPKYENKDIPVYEPEHRFELIERGAAAAEASLAADSAPALKKEAG